MPLGHHFNIQQTGVTGRGLNGVVEVELFRRPGSRKFSQPAHRNLDVARTQLNAVVEIFEISPIPNLHRALVFTLAADADPLGVIAVVTEGRGTLGANPFVTAGMAFFLFFKALFEFLDQLFQATQTLDFGFVFL